MIKLFLLSVYKLQCKYMKEFAHIYDTILKKENRSYESGGIILKSIYYCYHSLQCTAQIKLLCKNKW